MAAVIVIGVGTTGLDIIEQTQQFYYEYTKKDAPDNAAFMFLETAKKQPKTTPNGTTKIEPCNIWTDNIEATLGKWRKSKKYNWLPSDADVLNQHDGAANQPSIGRVALWANEDKVFNHIQKLYQGIHGGTDTNIYIVGSLTGGTGTGIFLDLAYMVRKATGNENIYGMFLLPSRHGITDGTQLLYENAFSSLRTLDYYSVTKANKTVNTDEEAATASNYSCTLPSGAEISSTRVPFKNAQFLTPDFSDATASLTDLKQLVQSAGFNLVLRLLNVDNQTAVVQSTMDSKRVDYFSFVKRGLYTSVGMNVFQYPEALLEEYLTTSLLEDNLLKRWNDTTNYLDQHNTTASIQTLTARLRNESTRFTHEAIEQAIEKCQGSQMLGKSTFSAAINAELDTILSGNYQAIDEEHYITSLFSADIQTKFYAAISGQATILRDHLIDAIYKKIQDISTQYQNLKVVSLWIDGISSELERVLTDWRKRYKIDGSPKAWNQCWNYEYEDRLMGSKFMYTITGCKKQYYQEALISVATLCYYNSFVPMITDVVNSMLNRNGAYALSTAAGVKVPTLEDLSKISAKVTTLLNPQDDTSLVARSASIHGQLSNQNNSQFHFLFNGLTCDDDVKVANGKYMSQPERLDYPRVSYDKLWDFLSKNDYIDIKSIMIAKGLEFVRSLNLFDNTDVVNIMTHLPKQHIAYNKVHNLLHFTKEDIVADTPAMVHLINTEQFNMHDSLKLIVMSPLSEDNDKGIVNVMTKFKPSIAQRDYIQIPAMKNTIVVYQEYGYLGSVDGKPKAFNPLVHVCYQAQILEKIKEKIKSKEFDSTLRLAYIDEKTLVDTKNVNIK